MDWLEKVIIRPLMNKKFVYYLKLGFDSADASLLEIADFNSDSIIITEDKDMLDQGVTKRQNIIKLSDFFAILEATNFFTKKEFKLLIERLYKMIQISKSKKKQILGRSK